MPLYYKFLTTYGVNTTNKYKSKLVDLKSVEPIILQEDTEAKWSLVNIGYGIKCLQYKLKYTLHLEYLYKNMLAQSK